MTVMMQKMRTKKYMIHKSDNYEGLPKQFMSTLIPRIRSSTYSLH